ncbi:MAG: hypothetical protein AAF265_02875 [Pseudomonadota bacterium]
MTLFASALIGGCAGLTVTSDGVAVSRQHGLRFQLSPGWERVDDTRGSADFLLSFSEIDESLLAMSRLPKTALGWDPSDYAIDALASLALGERFLALIASDMELPIFSVLDHEASPLAGRPAVRLRIGYQSTDAEHYTVSYVLVPRTSDVLVIQCQTVNRAHERAADCANMVASVVWL